MNTIMEIDHGRNDETGEQTLHIMLPGRAVTFRVSKLDDKAAWAIASLPPHPSDGSGYLHSPSEWIEVLARAFTA